MVQRSRHFFCLSPKCAMFLKNVGEASVSGECADDVSVVDKIEGHIKIERSGLWEGPGGTNGEI